MTDIPIIFSAPMIRALLDGRKSMTRRLAWRVEPVWSDGGIIPDGCGGYMDHVEPHWITKGKPSLWQRVRPGDRLWVRENVWQSSRYPGTLPSGEPEPASWCWGNQVHHDADGNPPNCGNRTYGPDGLRNGAFAAPDPDAVWIKRPSIHMPRWASRLTLIVTGTKIERVQEITNQDCIGEGADVESIGPLGQPMVRIDGKSYHHQTVTLWFHRLWEQLHGPDSWDANPEVVALTFTVHKQNIDALAKEAA